MTVAFDTLKLARRLEGVGFSREQADGTAAALAETLTGEIATKVDLAELRTELKGDIMELRLEMQAEFAKIRAEIGKIWGEMGGIRGEISQLRADTAKWIISAVFVNLLTSIGLVAAVWQLAHK